MLAGIIMLLLWITFPQIKVFSFFHQTILIFVAGRKLILARVSGILTRGEIHRAIPPIYEVATALSLRLLVISSALNKTFLFFQFENPPVTILLDFSFVFLSFLNDSNAKQILIKASCSFFWLLNSLLPSSAKEH